MVSHSSPCWIATAGSPALAAQVLGDTLFRSVYFVAKAVGGTEDLKKNQGNNVFGSVFSTLIEYLGLSLFTYLVFRT